MMQRQNAINIVKALNQEANLLLCVQRSENVTHHEHTRLNMPK